MYTVPPNTPKNQISIHATWKCWALINTTGESKQKELKVMVYAAPWLLDTFKIYLFLFYVYGCFACCVPMDHIAYNAWGSLQPLDLLELELQIADSHCVGSGNWTQIL